VLLLPAIDLRNGRCVRLYQGDFEAQTDYAVSPRELLQRYRALGAPWVHVVDLDGAHSGLSANRALIVQLAQSPGAPRLQVGGGIRSASAIAQLLAAGVARVVVGSAAIEQPHALLAWLREFGRERLCVAFDVQLDNAGQPQVRTHGWRQASGLTLWEALARFPQGTLRHVLCTDIARDGALKGANFELYRSACGKYPEFAWQASGGVRDVSDLAALAASGVAAAISGRALLERRFDLKELRPFLPGASSPASTSATARS
jgi:phosphoribosylformimino-5-aminoimidazole carboxamide ribotide isomerase